MLRTDDVESKSKPMKKRKRTCQCLEMKVVT